MFNLEELFSKRNQKEALISLKRKSNDKQINNIEDNWNLNKEVILKKISSNTYKANLIKIKEIINGKGKKRSIAVLSDIDKFITRLLSQKLNRYLDPLFLDSSYAFRDSKGVQDAVEQCRIYIEGGCEYVVNIDIKDFFDNINHERMNKLIDDLIKDTTVKGLISVYISCDIQIDNHIEHKTKGLVQGSSISPILSNLYLNELDKYMEYRGYCWVRFADDINIYTNSLDEAGKILNDVTTKIKQLYLPINEIKTGIYNPLERTYIGYDFYKSKNGIEISKHVYKRLDKYTYWHDCSIEKVNHEYHLVKNGVINKQDYSLLFESDKEKYHIPVEVVDQITIYNDVTIVSTSLKYLSEKGIKLAYVNRFGQPEGYYIPQKKIHSNQTLVNQFKEYIDEDKRLKTAKSIEIAGFHNIRSNIKYYAKKKKIDFSKEINEISKLIIEVNEAKDINSLMLLEARCRQKYYLCFNKILNKEEFKFINRSKRPPKDPINTLISFENTLLYNEILFMIYKTSLDPRIGIIHSTTRRNFTLNLDFADLFKPIIVDRTIFSLINNNQIKADKHFEKYKEDGLYLNDDGKRIVIKKFEEKLNDKITIHDKHYTYRQLIEKEIFKYLDHINNDTKYKPYKYY